MALIRLDHVTKRYRDRIALSDVSLSFDPGEWVFVLGPSGAGKSTLLRVLALGGSRRNTDGKSAFVLRSHCSVERKSGSRTCRDDRALLCDLPTELFCFLERIEPAIAGFSRSGDTDLDDPVSAGKPTKIARDRNVVRMHYASHCLFSISFLVKYAATREQSAQ